MRVTVLGGGNGAFATAGHLALEDHAVTLCELPRFADGIASLRGDPTITVESEPYTGLPSGRARLVRATTEPAEALADCDVVIVVTPSFGHAPFARAIARHLRPDHTVLIAPGNLWGALEFRRALDDAGGSAGVTVGEAACLIYACRKTGPTGIRIRGYKHNLKLAAYPASETSALVETMRRLYPTVDCGQTIVETGLSNVNPFFHTPILLHNAARIEAGGNDFRFYVDGSSPGVGRVIEGMDAERMAIGQAVGVPVEPLGVMTLRWYAHEGAEGEGIHALHHSVPAYLVSRSPKGLGTRYLSEDVPYGLAPIAELGCLAGVATPLIDGVTSVLSAFAGSDLGTPARSLRQFGLGELSVSDLVASL